MSILLAKFFGLFFSILGPILFIKRNQMGTIIADLHNNKMLQFLMGVIPIIIGSGLVAVHNVWVKDWRLFITLLSWLFIVVGVYRLLFVDKWLARANALCNNTTAICLISTAMLAIGLCLLYCAHCAQCVH